MPIVYSRKELDASFLCIKNKKNPAPQNKKGSEVVTELLCSYSGGE
tara:strand:+ start:2794 stop:2931 length:138 start_codon:yes stop_codon:yes gene_type:complete